MKKFLALLLSVLMLIGIMPFSAFAANDYTINSTTSTDDYYNLISKKDWDIAPGITESEIVLNNDAGSRRQVLYVMEADLNNEYVKVINSYMGMVPQYGDYKIGTMSQQSAYAEANGYGNIVGAMNTTLSWYTGYADDRVNEPLGFIMLDAEIFFDPGNCGYTYGNVGFPSVLVINKDFDKDGNPRPADIPKVEMPQIRSAADLDGWEDQVIPCSSGYIVKDGVNQQKSANHSDAAPRSVVGIKPDGTVVIMLNDGRQAPTSTGMSMYELAEVMLDLGCSFAVNCDGGGSSTYLSQRPGEDLKVNNVPSDGAERETTTGILFISTAPATGEFARANISSDNDYYTPNSVVKFTALGTDLVGTEADIPAEAYWQLADTSFGTIENGVFTSNGKQGAVTVQLVYNDEVVGEDTINIVMPDTIEFVQGNMVIPYGREVEIAINATYDSKPVTIKVADVEFVLSNNSLGTLNGFVFNAAEESEGLEPGTITATIGELTIVANIALGKGTEIAYDFEDNNLDGWSIWTNYPQYGPKGPNGSLTDANGNYWYHGQNERGYISIVDETTGKVRNGKYALAMECDFSQPYETGFHSLNMRFPKIDTTDAVSVGFWIYVPYDARHSDLTINSVLGEKFFADGSAYELVGGWNYVKLNAPSAADGFYDISISVDERASTKDANGKDYYNYLTEPNLNGKYTFYIDDISVDYSTAVDDRENPVFSNLSLLDTLGSVNAAITGQTIKFNNPTLEARVADFAADNATGIDASTAKAYIDGEAVDCTYANGKVSVNGLSLADGAHTVKFEIKDNAGNTGWIKGNFSVNAGTDASTIKVVPADPTADRLLIGSLYWMDVVATDAEKVGKVEMTFDLNNASYWELEGMTVAAGFSADWSIQADENIATITITRTGKVSLTGEAVIAKFPVRTWESHITEYEGYEDQTPATLIKRAIIWHQAIELILERGVVTYTDDTTSTFGMDRVLVDTELFFNNYSRNNVPGAVEWRTEKQKAGIGFHEHTAVAVDDKAATCTEDGYANRTYCDECDSVVDWGKITFASGHNHKLVNGAYVCENCGDEKGTANGLVEDGGVYRYYINGVAQSGWIMVDKDWHYFDAKTMAAKAGKYNVNGIEYEFEETGKLVSGVWAKTLYGTRYFYGPDCYGTGWYEIDGNRYFFQNTYRYEGYRMIFKAKIRRWYNFGDDGICREDEVINGFYWDADNGLGYVVDNVGVEGLHKIDGNYYYFNYYGYAVKGFANVGSTNCDMPTGNYYFGDDYKAYTGLVEKNGTTYYYENGRAKLAGLVEVDGDIYFAGGANGEITIGKKIYVWKGNGILPEANYEFGEDGKLLNGIVEKNGTLYYYKNGQPRNAGLVEVDGDYYFAGGANGEITVGKKQHVWEGNGILPEATYEFGADGKMLKGIVEKNGTLYYYENGKAKMAGLVEIDGDYYFAGGANGEITANKVTYVWKDNGIALDNANCEFGADGKMLNGIVEKKGTLYYYVMGRPRMAGLVEIDGDYYFAGGANGEITVNKITYVWKDNGIALDNANCEFDADGKMLNGIVEKNGTLYYYVMGRPRMAGLIEIDGDYYFADGANGEITVGKKKYVWKSNGLLPEANYEFGADGKMLNGIVEKNGTLYYYKNGKAELAGLVEVDGAYYFVSGVNGEVTVNKKQYVWDGNGLLPEANYEFGADGKMLDGFVTKADGIYYYQNGQPGRVGLNYIDGDYYFVDYGGKLFTNGTYFVWETNGYSIAMKYKFDELGKLILK